MALASQPPTCRKRSSNGPPASLSTRSVNPLPTQPLPPSSKHPLRRNGHTFPGPASVCPAASALLAARPPVPPSLSLPPRRHEQPPHGKRPPTPVSSSLRPVPPPPPRADSAARRDPPRELEIWRRPFGAARSSPTATAGGAIGWLAGPEAAAVEWSAAEGIA
jgi:hypothetical protein